MLVDNYITLNKVFSNSEVLIATHCEREEIIKANLALAKNNYGDQINIQHHPIIRNVEACYESSYSAVQLAKQTGARLHILHISTAKELQLFGNMMPLKDKQITTEVCVHHLHFTADDYAKYGNQIKCNPAIKSAENKDALWTALLDDRLDIVATDHAPHTWQEKSEPYINAPSGVPLVQHSLLLMLDYKNLGKITIEKIVEKMCHAPAICFNVKDRGFIREGYFADLVVVDTHQNYKVTKENILYKCGWSPFEEHTFSHTIDKTFVSGNLVYSEGKINDSIMGQRLEFDRM
jgi:dihydroorotase